MLTIVCQPVFAQTATAMMENLAIQPPEVKPMGLMPKSEPRMELSAPVFSGERM